MSDSESDAAWIHELRNLEDRLQERLQTLDDRLHQRVQDHELHGVQTIAGIFSRSTTQVNFMLGLLVTVLGGGVLTIYLGSRAYVDESLRRAETSLNTSVTTRLEDFKRNLMNGLRACLERSTDADVRDCLEKALGGPTP